MALFREQAVARQRQRLYGEVRLDTPLSAYVLTALIGALVLGLACALAFGSYARKETVTGWLVPDRGLARVAAPEPSVVEAVHVRQGQRVEAGTPLLTMSADAALTDGSMATDALLDQLARERSELATQIDLTSRRAEADRVAQGQRRDQLLRERREVMRQLTAQEARVRLVREEAHRYEGLLEDAAASPLEVGRARERVLAAEQEAAGLRQRAAAMQREADGLAAALARSPLDEASALSELRARLATLDQRRTEYARRGGVVLRAPVSGTVSALAVRVGESVPAGLPLAAVLPENGVLEAELFVPTRAAGFVARGQTARLQLDAFPHQKFGLLEGRIARVSSTVSSPGELPVPLPDPLPVYRSTVTLNAQAVDAYGQEFPLQAGMMVRADIVQERRGLWRVLLDPLLSRS